MSKVKEIPNFSWLEPGVIAGSSFPYEEGHFHFFKEQGIKVIVNLTENGRYNLRETSILESFEIHHIPVQDFTAPKVDQLVQFLELIQQYREQSMPIVVHCVAGCGRTGTFLAAFLIKTTGNNPEIAIKALRQSRPCSIESNEQEHCLLEYYQLVQHI